MDTLHQLATLLPLALTSGFNLYLTVLTAGLCIRYGVVTEVPQPLSVLSSWPVLSVAAVLFLLEFLADKVSFVDNVWDAVHTFIRPLGAAVLAVAAFGTADPMITVLAALAAGSVALVSHGGKAGGRAALNILSPFETATNIGVSLAENVLVGALAWLAIRHPYAAAAVALVIFTAIVVFVPLLARWAWLTLRALFARVKGLVAKVSDNDALPSSQMALLGHRPPEIAGACKAGKLPGAGGRSGFLSYRERALSFTFDKWWSTRLFTVDQASIKAAYVRRRILVDILEVHYEDQRLKPRIARFVFLKDRAPLLDRLAAAVGARKAG